MPLQAPTRLSGTLAVLTDTPPSQRDEDLLDSLLIRAGARPEVVRMVPTVWCGLEEPCPASLEACADLVHGALEGVGAILASGPWAIRRLVGAKSDYAYRGSFYWTGESVTVGQKTVLGPAVFKTGARAGQLKPRKVPVVIPLTPCLPVVYTLSMARLIDAGLAPQPLVLADLRRVVRLSRGEMLVEVAETVEIGQLPRQLDSLLDQSELTLDLETDGLNGKIQWIGLAPDRSFAHVTRPEPDVLQKLGRWLADPSHTLVVHNTSFDVRVLEREGISVKTKLWDTMHAAHYELPGLKKFLSPIALDTVCSRMDRMAYWNWKEDFRSGATPDLAYYCGRDVAATAYLRQELGQRLHDTRRLESFETVLMPLQRALIDMETIGVQIDRAALARLQSRQEYIVRYLQDAWTRVYPGLDPNSPTQLKAYFYDTLGIPPIVHYKTKKPTLGREALLELADRYPEHASLMDLVALRHAQKILATYLQLPLDAQDRLHPKYNLSGTSTGRLSGGGSDEETEGLNFQNFPKAKEACPRGIDGCGCVLVRELFVADPGHHGVAVCDYSQIESRLTALLGNETELLKKYDDPDFDEHQWIADLAHVARDSGKMLNHATNYGMGEREVARRLKVPVKVARELLRKIREAKPNITRYRDRLHQIACKQGYITNRFGRRLYFQPVRKRTPYGERWEVEPSKVAAADPQSTAGDVIHRAALRVVRAGLHLRLQVHDELMVSMEYLDDGKILKECMEEPFEELGGWFCRADLGEGPNWAEAKRK